MMKFVERYSFELIFGIAMLFTLKFILLGYNILGMYDLNVLFIQR